MKVLFIGDVFGKPGRLAVSELLPLVISKYGPFEAIIANGENAAGGKGVTKPIIKSFWELGINVVTTGNHVWAQREVFSFIDSELGLLRPANYPPNTPGRGWVVISTASEMKLCVINIAGQIFLDNFSNPFHCLDEILKEVSVQTEHIILDFHAEATSEKIAMGWYADGRVSAVIGTHTHIQTADDRILHQGTAYITDVGMTGPYDSVIGTNKEEVLYRFTTMLPVRYKVAQEEVVLCGVVLDLDDKSGNAKSIERVQIPL